EARKALPMSDAIAVRFRNVFRGLYAAIALIVFAGDQATKVLVKDSVPEHTVIPIIPHFLNLTHTKNAGVAFGLFSDAPAPWKTAVLIVVSVVLLVAVAGIVVRSRHLHWESGVGLAMILGGALSNLLDRIRTGRVVDFVDVYFRSYHWPTFNLADSAIVVGAIFLILQLIFFESDSHATSFG
ncbi:MAG TPA: signal peptidase II, partial [Terriglobia bacterium]|nr:signal peptidase II [Terriglobia bacterium]